MKWTAIKQSEHSAKGNHTSWRPLGQDILKQRICIICTCHEGEQRDMRWINRTQITEE